jgi:glutathionyl-hydroquinone reductase
VEAFSQKPTFFRLATQKNTCKGYTVMLPFLKMGYDGETYLFDSPDSMTDTARHMDMTGNGIFGNGRPSQKFRSWLSQGPRARYPACEKDRYVLYASYACPWATRTLIVRELQELYHIDVAITSFELPYLSDANLYRGWKFENKSEFGFLDELYNYATPGYTDYFRQHGKRPMLSVPVLYDSIRNEIVSTESSDIIRMFNRMKCSSGTKNVELEPVGSMACMNKTDTLVYPAINDGVYRMGFARTQSDYTKNYVRHWDAMDKVNNILLSNTFLCGNTLTLSDVRLFVTLIRYDLVYYSHFKGSRNQVKEMDGLYNFVERMMRTRAFNVTLNTEHIVRHYYGSQLRINLQGYTLLVHHGRDRDRLKSTLTRKDDTAEWHLHSQQTLHLQK